MVKGVYCTTCGYDDWTVLRRWYMGHRAVWFCWYCYEIVPTLRLVKPLAR